MTTITFIFNPEKALEAILYASRIAPIPDIYHVLKILYFADKAHLERYGRFIFGDSYVAMSKGPVPSGAYDIINYVRGKSTVIPFEPAKSAFSVFEYSIKALREPNLELLSKSDIKCIDEAVAKYGNYDFNKLHSASCDRAYENADKNDFMSVESIASTLEDGDLIIEHLNAQ